jgi:hypothetical protein
MAHKRGTRWHAKHFARHLVLDSAHFDKEIKEVVAQTDTESVKAKCNALGYDAHDVKDVEKGEVLEDTRGRGSMQRAFTLPRQRGF